MVLNDDPIRTVKLLMVLTAIMLAVVLATNLWAGRWFLAFNNVFAFAPVGAAWWIIKRKKL